SNATKCGPLWVAKFAGESRLRVPVTTGQSSAPLLRAVIFVMVPFASVSTGGALHLTRVRALSSFCMSRTMTRREWSPGLSRFHGETAKPGGGGSARENTPLIGRTGKPAAGGGKEPRRST